MDIQLESFDPRKHDTHILAELIFSSDKEMNSLVYGEHPVQTITQLIEGAIGYFTPDHMKCAMTDDTLVGVIVSYPESKRKQVDKSAGKAFIRIFGFFPFLKKLPLYMKMAKMLGGTIDPDSTHIHTIAVDPKYQGKGIGSCLLDALAKENVTLYLYVNAKNDNAIRFYKKNGFYEKYKGIMKHKGKKYSECMMVRT